MGGFDRHTGGLKKGLAKLIFAHWLAKKAHLLAEAFSKPQTIDAKPCKSFKSAISEQGAVQSRKADVVGFVWFRIGLVLHWTGPGMF